MYEILKSKKFLSEKNFSQRSSEHAIVDHQTTGVFEETVYLRSQKWQVTYFMQREKKQVNRGTWTWSPIVNMWSRSFLSGLHSQAPNFEGKGNQEVEVKHPPRNRAFNRNNVSVTLSPDLAQPPSIICRGKHEKWQICVQRRESVSGILAS